ncbi:hypothetical protein DL96DRAFT_567289 [Flagelloscypha sp. PMI_526]|nr:hypothetical protein DL96DRAFT_567289 [Flagelloscypha sp. PMI_526]
MHRGRCQFAYRADQSETSMPWYSVVSFFSEASIYYLARIYRAVEDALLYSSFLFLSPNMTSIHSLVGCLMISSWVNTVLFGIQLTHGYKYFKYYHDEMHMKVIVAVVFVVDIFSLCGEYTRIYRSSITHYGDPTYLKQEFLFARVSYLFGIQIIGAIVQTFLISRIWRLSRNIWVALILMAGVLLSFGGGFTVAMMNILFQTISVEARARQKLPTSIWLVTAAVDDVLIAVILVYYLWQAKQRTSFQQTQNILSRLMASSLETGSLTALCAIVVEILFQKLTGTNLQAGAVWLLGRAYSLTLTYNLLLRRDLRKNSPSHQTASGLESYVNNNTMTISRVPQTKADGAIEIQVAHTHVSHVDQPQIDAKQGLMY